MKRKFVTVLALLLMAAAAAAAEEAPAPEIIRIGTALPLHVDPQQSFRLEKQFDSTSVEKAAAGVQLGLLSAIREINQSQKHIQLHLNVADDRFAAVPLNDAVRVMLNDEKVDALIFFSQIEAASSAELLRSANVPVLVLNVMFSMPTERSLKEMPPNVFLLDYKIPKQESFVAAVERFFASRSLKRLALLSSDRCREYLEKTFGAPARDKGIAVTSVVAPSEATPDYTKIAGDIANANSELALLCYGSKQEPIEDFIAGLRKAGAAVPVLTTYPLGPLTRGISLPEVYTGRVIDVSSAAARKYAELFKGNTISPMPDMLEARAFDAINIIWQAITLRGKFASDLSRSMCLIHAYEGASGLTDFTKSRFSEKPTRIFQVKGTELQAMEYVEPQTVSCGCGIEAKDENKNGVIDCLERKSAPSAGMACRVIGVCRNKSGETCACYDKGDVCGKCDCCPK